jgi:hypothetical protein
MTGTEAVSTMNDAWTGKPESKGMLHQRQVERKNHCYRMLNVDRPECFVHQTYTRKPFGARRNVFAGTGARGEEENNFRFVIAAAVFALVTFAALKEAPIVYSAACHTLHSKAVIHEMHELRALI